MIFSAVLSIASLLMMVALLDSSLGLQPAAFIGTAGLTFVALAPTTYRKTNTPYTSPPPSSPPPAASCDACR